MKLLEILKFFIIFTNVNAQNKTVRSEIKCQCDAGPTGYTNFELQIKI
jgi:hypothetical protein